jgi:hypothetical protein
MLPILPHTADETRQTRDKRDRVVAFDRDLSSRRSRMLLRYYVGNCVPSLRQAARSASPTTWYGRALYLGRLMKRV